MNGRDARSVVRRFSQFASNSIVFIFWRVQRIDIPACQHWSLGMLASTHNAPIFRCESRAKCEREILSECERCNSLSLLTVFFLAVVLPTWINEVHQQRRQIKSYPPYSVRITLYFVNSGKKEIRHKNETSAHANGRKSEFVCRLMLQKLKKEIWKCKLQVAFQCAVGWCIPRAPFAVA